VDGFLHMTSHIGALSRWRTSNQRQVQYCSNASGLRFKQLANQSNRRRNKDLSSPEKKRRLITKVRSFFKNSQRNDDRHGCSDHFVKGKANVIRSASLTHIFNGISPDLWEWLLILLNQMYSPGKNTTAVVQCYFGSEVVDSTAHEIVGSL